MIRLVDRVAFNVEWQQIFLAKSLHKGEKTIWVLTRSPRETLEEIFPKFSAYPKTLHFGEGPLGDSGRKSKSLLSPQSASRPKNFHKSHE